MPSQCIHGSVQVFWGLVCDPIAGLVEAPCQSRNAMGASNALICAEQALAGIPCPIPFDEMAEAMYHVGRSLPFGTKRKCFGRMRRNTFCL